MPIEANYETYYGIKLEHYTYSWGGITYGGPNTIHYGILVKEFPDEYLVSVPTTDANSMSFLYPRPIVPKGYIDGTAEGHFSVYNVHSSTTSTVTSYTVALKKTNDVPSNETTLGSYSATLSTASEVLPEDYLNLPFYIQLVEQELNAEEKLILYITWHGTDEDNLCFSHENDSNIIDIKIKVPFAPEGY